MRLNNTRMWIVVSFLLVTALALSWRQKRDAADSTSVAHTTAASRPFPLVLTNGVSGSTVASVGPVFGTNLMVEVVRQGALGAVSNRLAYRLTNSGLALA